MQLAAPLHAAPSTAFQTVRIAVQRGTVGWQPPAASVHGWNGYRGGKSLGSEDPVRRRLDLLRSLAACSAVLLSLAVHERVRASDVRVALGPTSAVGFSQQDAQHAAAALSDALRMQGLSVLPRAQRGADVDELALDAGACDRACGAQLMEAASAELAAWVKLSMASRARGGSAEVTLQDGSGHRFQGTAEIRDGDVREATTRAVLDARSYQLLGPGPWLRIEGTPEGAEVLVDGERVGTLPYRAGVAPGKHEVVVREAGYLRFNQSVSVPSDESRRQELRIALEPTPIDTQSGAVPLATAEPYADSAPRDSAWLAAPVAMGMLGLGLASVISVRLLTGYDPCVGESDSAGFCLESRTLRVGPTVGGYALSAMLIGGSITWIVLGLQNNDASSEQVALRARVGLGTLQLSGSF